MRINMSDLSQGVRRRLFQDGNSSEPGSADPRTEAGEGENITNSLLEQIKLEQEAAKTRWNFDFQKEEPQQGRWEWVKKGDTRFENFGEEEKEEFFLASDIPETRSNDADNIDGDQSNDVFVDASNVPNNNEEKTARSILNENSTAAS